MDEKPYYVWKKANWYNRMISRRRGQPVWETYFQEGRFFPMRVVYWDREVFEDERRMVENGEVVPQARKDGVIRAYDWRKFFSGRF